jgi:hypothetical protein
LLVRCERGKPDVVGADLVGIVLVEPDVERQGVVEPDVERGRVDRKLLGRARRTVFPLDRRLVEHSVG